jgi:hypothetical protein
LPLPHTQPLTGAATTVQTTNRQGNTNFCEEGKQPLFSAYMIYQVHLFIFLLAVTHVVYVAGTLLVCLFQVGMLGAPAGRV